MVFIPNFSSVVIMADLSINSGVLFKKFSEKLNLKVLVGLQQSIFNLLCPLLKGKKTEPYPIK